MPDCEPVAIALVVCNNQLSGAKGPVFDAERSCAQLTEALESYGVMVITVVNKSREYLAAILTNLASRNIIPESCKFLWLIFSGHGWGSYFLVSGELVAFNQLIHLASTIKIRRMAFFFDCCRLSTNSINVVNIQKEHMVLYSAPPNEKAYHFDGISLMVMCFVKLLHSFEGSLNELQSKLREMLVSKMAEVLHIPSDMLDDWRQNHLPYSTSSMFDINLCSEISEASKCCINTGSPVILR